MNTLVLSAGTRNKVIEYFGKSVSGRVIAADAAPTAPALYVADECYIVPHLGEPGYLDAVLEICQKEKVDALLSLIDPELCVLAKHEDLFAKINAKVIGSPYELTEMALDKMSMYHWLESHGYKCAKSFISKESFYRALDDGQVCFPVIVKPVKGSASLSINVAHDAQTVEFLFDHDEGLMIQEYLDGQEIGADCYIDMVSGELVSAFTKKKLLMRAGETDKAVSFKSAQLFDLLERFVDECGWRGPIDIDLFDVDGEYYISEVNPRFGGGYPHAYECGCDFISLISSNVKGFANVKAIGDYDEGVYMMKYNELVVRRF